MKNQTKPSSNASKNNTAKEADNMVKKAAALTSLDDLNLSLRTRRYLEKKDSTIDETVLSSRKMALSLAGRPEEFAKKPKWQQELLLALEEAGYIRYDLVPRTWNIWGLYSAIMCYNLSTKMVFRNSFTNEDYENLSPVSDEELDQLIMVINSLLEREQIVIKMRYGIPSSKPMDLASIGKQLGVTTERVRQLEAKAIRKMRHYRGQLPALFGFVPPEKPKRPEPTYHLEGDITVMDLNTSIDDLDLTVRAYYCLKNAGFKTLSDIINFPKEDWPKVRNLSRRALQNVTDQVHAAGYPEFSTPFLE